MPSSSENKNISPYSSEPTILTQRALRHPVYTKLTGKRLILASSSPRRLKILRDLGINPEQIPSTFQEDLDHSSFDEEQEVHDSKGSKALRYAAATAAEKALEVYTRLVTDSPDQAPDLVIGADTVIQIYTPDTELNASGIRTPARIIEKPKTKEDQILILEELINLSPTDTRIEAVTSLALVYPQLASPGYTLKSFGQSTRLFFNNLDRQTVLAYVEQGEGIDRAGGFSIEGVGSQLIQRIEGDWNNVVGFPASGFIEFLKQLIEEDEDFLDD